MAGERHLRVPSPCHRSTCTLTGLRTTPVHWQSCSHGNGCPAGIMQPAAAVMTRVLHVIVPCPSHGAEPCLYVLTSTALSEAPDLRPTPTVRHLQAAGGHPRAGTECPGLCPGSPIWAGQAAGPGRGAACEVRAPGPCLAVASRPWRCHVPLQPFATPAWAAEQSCARGDAAPTQVPGACGEVLPHQSLSLPLSSLRLPQPPPLSSPLPTPLPRFLVRVEEGYRANDYHHRTHAADVLRNIHCIATRGGLLECPAPKHPLEQQPASEEDGPGDGSGGDAGRQDLSHGDALMLLSAYIAAVVHDFEHMGGCGMPLS